MKMQEYISLKDLEKGGFFKRNTHTEKVYIRGDYVRGEDYLGRKLNAYECFDFEDTNSTVMIKGNVQVFVNFEF